MRRLAIFALLCCIKCSASDLDFYHRFLSLVDTNESRAAGVTNGALVDKSNTAPRLTNAAISLQKLTTDGEVGNIRLRMTMDEVIARWGKPTSLHPRCDGGHLFNFTDCSLVFQGNSLYKVRFQGSAIFDQGLSGQSNIKQWGQVLGEPTAVNKDAHGSRVVYERHGRVRTVLFLTFDPDGDAKFPPALYLDPPLTNWFKKSQP
jgi:hypothetical protein